MPAKLKQMRIAICVCKLICTNPLHHIILAAGMQVHFDIERLPQIHKAVVTIGTFDGVHLGHQKIIQALQKEAARIGGETVIITFNPHPRKVLSSDPALQLITTLEEKINLLGALGVNHVVVVPFTKAFASQSAEDYIKDFLVGRFHPHTVIIGYDHRFGQGRQGDYKLLEEKAAIYHYQLLEIPKRVIEEISISSTKIRNALLSSDVETANMLLGYGFFFEGCVIKGDALGRQLGYPTANLAYTNADKIRLGEGVYAVYVHINGEEKKGMLSIGKRPTIDAGLQESVEVNIFDFDEDIYGATLKITVQKYLRPQEKYASLDELIQQLALDKENSLRSL